MEYMIGGDLKKLLAKKKTLKEDEASFYLTELVLTINSIHSTGVINRDLKTDKS